MRFFDKIDNGVIVNAFKQFLNRTDREIFFSRISRKFVHSTGIRFSVCGSRQKHRYSSSPQN